MDILSVGIPFLLVVEQVRLRGWLLANTEYPCTVLTNPLPTRFSAPMLARRVKAYFQCLVHLPQIFAKGLLRFAHGASAAYYGALLRSPRPAELDAGLSAEEYNEYMADVCPDFVADLPQGAFQGSDCELSSAKESDAPDDPVDGDGGGGDSDSPRGADLPVPGGGFVGTDDDSSSSGKSSSSVSTASVADAELRATYVIDNVTITLDIFHHKSEHKRSHKRYMIICNGCGHGRRCRKRRGCGLAQTRAFGQLEPIAFLLAWARMGHTFHARKDHIRFAVPTRAQIEVALHDVRTRSL